MRGIFWEEDVARAVAARLRRDGFDAALSREAFAGDDDDEDHPWAVRTDAPAYVLELLVEELDGWLEEDPAPPSAPLPPLDLPAAPRRHHRPGPR